MQKQKLNYWGTLILILILNIHSSYSQDKPFFFPEDVESKTLELNCHCKPGVANKSRSRGLEIAYHRIGKTEVEEGIETEVPPIVGELNSLQNVIFKLRFPIINRAGSKLILGGFYRPEKYKFNSIGPEYSKTLSYLDDLRLKSSGLELFYTKSLNEKNYLSLLFRNIYNGDYKGAITFDGQYAIYNIAALYGIKKTENLEWGIGLNYSSSFRTSMVLPFVLYNHTFNEHWGIEAVLPAMISARYNFSEKSILLAGIRYNSRSYAISVEDAIQTDELFNLNHSELRVTATLEQQLHPWIWIDLTIGFQESFNTEFMAASENATSFQIEPINAPYFKVGLFISPPDSFVK